MGVDKRTVGLRRWCDLRPLVRLLGLGLHVNAERLGPDHPPMAMTESSAAIMASPGATDTHEVLVVAKHTTRANHALVVAT